MRNGRSFITGHRLYASNKRNYVRHLQLHFGTWCRHHRPTRFDSLWTNLHEIPYRTYSVGSFGSTYEKCSFHRYDSCRQWSSKMVVADWKKIVIDRVASARSAYWKGNRLVEYVPINCVSIRQKRWPDVRQHKSMKQEAHTRTHPSVHLSVANGC